MTHDERPARDHHEEHQEQTQERQNQPQDETLTNDPRYSPSDENTRFEQAQARAEENAERAGASAARNLLGGILHGFGKRAAEELWELLTDSGA